MSPLARICRFALVGLIVLPPVLSPLAAAPLRVLVLGDSMSEEYAFELPFSAPDSDPLEANIANWIEILATVRGDEVSFGPYAGHVAAYPDYRDGGYAWNWAVPGFRTTDLAELVDPPLFPSSPEEALDWISCPRIRTQLAGEVDCAVIFCGGNDLSPLYAGLCTGTVATDRLEAIRDNLAATIDFVRAANATLPIVLVNAPDIGATPSVQAKVPDPALRAVATVRIAGLNALLAELAAARGIALANSFDLTRRLDGAAPLQLNGVEFLKAGDPENAPRYLFAKDGFHPSTAAQALLADEILRALNGRYGFGLSPLANREILGSILGLDPDAAFLAWLASAGLPPPTPADADPDGDRLPLLAEFALGLSALQPEVASRAVSAAIGTDAALRVSWPTDRSGGYVVLVPEWSTDLAGPWSEVPAAWYSDAGCACALPVSVGPRAFVRLRFGVRP